MSEVQDNFDVADDSEAIDAIYGDVPVLELPLEDRIALRKSGENRFGPDILDAIYGADTRDSKLGAA